MPKAETNRIVHEAVRKAQKRGIRIALTGYLIFFGGIVAERIVSRAETKDARRTIVDSGTAVAVNACNEQFKDRKAFRAVLIAARQNTSGRDDMTPKQRRTQIKFFNDRLSQLPMPDCRRALNVLSADPDADVRIPEPLYLKPAPEDRNSDRKKEEREQRKAGSD